MTRRAIELTGTDITLELSKVTADEAKFNHMTMTKDGVQG